MADRKVYIYKDRFTGDEMFSGAYPCTLVDDVVFCVEGKTIPKGGEAFDFCGTGDPEDGDVTLDDSVQMVINVVDTAGLIQTAFDKKSYMEHIKAYLNKVKAILPPERVPIFQKGAEVFVKKILTNFKEYDFFMNASMSDEGGVVLRFYKEDGITPYFYFFKDGVVLCFPGFGKDITGEALVPKDVAARQGFTI